MIEFIVIGLCNDLSLSGQKNECLEVSIFGDR